MHAAGYGYAQSGVTGDVLNDLGDYWRPASSTNQGRVPEVELMVHNPLLVELVARQSS